MMSWQASSIFIVLSFGFLTAPLTLAASLSNEKMPMNEILLKYSIPILVSIIFSLSLLIAGIFLLYNLRIANLRHYLVVNKIRKYLKIDDSALDNSRIIPIQWRKYEIKDFKEDAENRFSIWGILIHLYLTLVYVIIFVSLSLYAKVYQCTDSTIIIIFIIGCAVFSLISIYGIWKVIARKIYKKILEDIEKKRED